MEMFEINLRTLGTRNETNWNVLLDNLDISILYFHEGSGNDDPCTKKVHYIQINGFGRDFIRNGLDTKWHLCYNS